MNHDIICFSHLRWNFVYQRPQHLLSRFAKENRVFFFEEPVFDCMEKPFYSIKEDMPNLFVVVPHLIPGQAESEIVLAQKTMVDILIEDMNIEQYKIWYYSPMALAFSDHLETDLVVFDCMDELSAFKFAPPALLENENKLLKKADLVFTGGHSLYEAKKNRHPNIHTMQSAIDKEHFYPARSRMADPADQARIPFPRLGFYGVIDERFDLALVEKMASLKPAWQFIFIGPVVKIDPGQLPVNKNIHYLGGKNYRELPAYISNWDICIMPFAINESTRYISPTKTPEFLAAGKPVISSAITDVVNPYGINNLVHIKETAEGFIESAAKELAKVNRTVWPGQVDHFLSDISWDKTFRKMKSLMEDTIKKKKISEPSKNEAYV
jgi:glycosyltransferase involved in cell wall biosynthesis